MASDEQPRPAISPGSPGSMPAYTAEFLMYTFKIVPCTATYAHNWSLCPYVHQNEKARRRDPRLVAYEPLPCPWDKKGTNCPYGDACNYTHNVYEYNLHPARFRTQMCQQGAACRRPLCFFAHSMQELRFPDALRSQEAAAAAMPALPDAAAAGMQPGMAARSPGGMFVPGMPAGAAGLASPVAAMPGLMAGGYLPRALPPPPLQQQQQPWLPGYVTPQGYVLLGSPQAPQIIPGAPLMYFAPVMQPGAAEADAAARASQMAQQQQAPYLQQQQQQAPYLQQQQQQQAPYLQQQRQPQQLPPPPSYQQQQGGGQGFMQQHRGAGGQQWQRHAAPGTAPARRTTLSPAGGDVDTRPQLQLSAEDSALLSSQACSSALVQQQQAAELVSAAGVVSSSDAPLSGSVYSWTLPALPSTTNSTITASMSLSGMSIPSSGLSSSHALLGSSSSNVQQRLRSSQAGTAAATALEALQATMQQLQLRDLDGSHVRDL